MPPHLIYGGVYRYFNNPDLVTGYAALYGMALFCHSWTIFALALFFQASQALFQKLVETYVCVLFCCVLLLFVLFGLLFCLLVRCFLLLASLLLYTRV